MATIEPKGDVRIKAEGDTYRELEHDAIYKAREYFGDVFELHIVEGYVANETNSMSDCDPKFIAAVHVTAVLPEGEG